MKKFVPILPPVFIFFVTFIISGYFSSIGTDPHHDGIVLKPAIDIVNGKMLFRDTFTQYGALTALIQALAIKIFGEYLITIKLLTAFFYGLISILIYLIWSKFLSKGLALFSWLVWLSLAPYLSVVFLPWSSVYALFFQCFSLYLIIKYFDTKNKKIILLAGIFGGLAFWSKQNVGAYTITASIVSIVLIQVLSKKKISTSFLPGIRYLSGSILISLPIIFWIIINGAFSDWWKQSISYALFWAEYSKLHIFNHFFPRSISNFSIWSLIPIVTIIAFLKELFGKKPNLTIFTVSVFGLFSWLQYFPIPDIRHVYWAATPMIGITIYLFFKLSESINKKLIIKYFIFLFLFMLIFSRDLYFGIKSGFIKANQPYKYLDSPQVVKGMKLSASEFNFYKKTYEEIIKYEDLHGKTNIITTGGNSLYLTFNKSENFHPVYVDWVTINKSLIYPDYLSKRNAYININKPLIIAVEKKLPLGYCRVNNLVNAEDFAFLIAPCK
ncbi:MAG: glycosyltransferase family 39 protein [Patescibacteria group bacterium]